MERQRPSLSEKIRDDSLRSSIWQASKQGKCPFKTNRGFSHGDPHCAECDEDERLLCEVDTWDRLLAILYGTCKTLRDELWECNICTKYDDDPYDKDGKYFELAKGEGGDEEWLDEKRQEIRKIAQYIINQDYYPDKIHPNTRIYFNNCFPEWRDYERRHKDNDLQISMEEFYDKERENVFKWADSYYEEDITEESLIDRGDWRGFPFEDLFWNEADFIPKKIINNFTRDYFKWLKQIHTELQETAKIHGPFGKKSILDDNELSEWRQWMQDDKELNRWLKTRNGKFFLLLLRYFKLHKMSERRSEPIAEKFKCNKKYAFIQLDKIQISNWLCKRDTMRGIAVNPEKVRRFVHWMSDNKLIIKIGKPGSHAQMIYAIGKWRKHFPDSITGTMRSGGMDFFVIQKNKQKLKAAIRKQI